MSDIKTGDTVFHRPTAESWIVAYVEPERDELAWLGWPPGLARLSDCELVESCTDEESFKLLNEIADGDDDHTGYDHRRSWARRQLELTQED